MDERSVITQTSLQIYYSKCIKLGLAHQYQLHCSAQLIPAGDSVPPCKSDDHHQHHLQQSRLRALPHLPYKCQRSRGYFSERVLFMSS